MKNVIDRIIDSLIKEGFYSTWADQSRGRITRIQTYLTDLVNNLPAPNNYGATKTAHGGRNVFRIMIDDPMSNLDSLEKEKELARAIYNSLNNRSAKAPLKAFQAMKKPTGFLLEPPPGPAIPVIETDILVLPKLPIFLAISLQTSSNFL